MVAMEPSRLMELPSYQIIRISNSEGKNIRSLASGVNGAQVIPLVKSNHEAEPEHSAVGGAVSAEGCSFSSRLPSRTSCFILSS